MVKDFMWNHFKTTGDISAYLCFREINSCAVGKSDKNMKDCSK